MVRSVPHHIRMAWGLMVVTLLAAGCAATQPEAPHGGDPVPGQTRELAEQVSSLYPDRFQALHRVGLTIRDRSLVMKGYLKINRPEGAVHLVAQGEMGGTLFEIRIRKNKGDVIKTTPYFKRRWLEKSVAGDLRHLYLPPEFQAPRAFKRDGRLLLSDAKGGRTLTYRFDDVALPEPRLSELSIKKKHREIYRIQYTYAGNSRLPAFIRLENKSLDYTLKINVRYLIPGKTL